MSIKKSSEGTEEGYTFRVIETISYGSDYVMGSVQFRKLKKVVTCLKGGKINVHDTDNFENRLTKVLKETRTIMKWDERVFFIIGQKQNTASYLHDHTVLVFTFSKKDDTNIVLQHSFQKNLKDVRSTLKLNSNSFVAACTGILCIVDYSSSSIIRKVEVRGITDYTTLVLSKSYKDCFFANFDASRKPIRRYNFKTLIIEQEFIHEDDVYTNTYSTFLNKLTGDEMLVCASDSPPIIFLYNTAFSNFKHLVKKFRPEGDRIFYSNVIIPHPEEHIIGYGDIGGRVCIFRFLNIDDQKTSEKTTTTITPQMKPLIITDRIHSNTVSKIEIFRPTTRSSPVSENYVRLITSSRDSQVKIVMIEGLKYYDPHDNYAQKKMMMEDLKERIGFIFLFSSSKDDVIESSNIYIPKQEQSLRKISLRLFSGNELWKDFGNIPKSFFLL